MTIESRREAKLRKIQEHLTEVLRETAPEEAERYKIVYKPIKSYHSSIFGDYSQVLPSQSPAYGFFLVSEDRKGGNYPLMHLFKQDVDRSVKEADIRGHYQIPAFEREIREGIVQLKEKEKGRKAKGGGLEKTLGIISIFSLILCLLFLSGITGNIIGFGLSSNFARALFFILGVIGSYFVFRRK